MDLAWVAAVNMQKLCQRNKDDHDEVGEAGEVER